MKKLSLTLAFAAVLSFFAALPAPASLARRPDRIVPSPSIVVPAESPAPVHLRTAKGCRYFIDGAEVTWDEFNREPRNVDVLNLNDAGEVIRMEAKTK